jgi:cytochrome subunit of sulfide dehydrogenase
VRKIVRVAGKPCAGLQETLVIKPWIAAALLASGASLHAQTPATPAAPAPAATVAPVPTTTNAAYLAANCANCHGMQGKALNGMPSLAGQNKDYIVKQMQDFRDGKRPATIMHQLAKGYTDEQIALMADYFSKQKAN